MLSGNVIKFGALEERDYLLKEEILYGPEY